MDQGDQWDKPLDQAMGDEDVATLYGPEESPAVQQAKEAAQPESNPEPEQQSVTPVQPVSTPQVDDNALWTSEEAQAIAILANETEVFTRELQHYEQWSKADINQIAKGDPEKAKAIRAELVAQKVDLTEKYEQLKKAETELQKRAHQRQAKRINSRLEGERQRLNQRVPDMDQAALKTYLVDQGFTQQEIGTAHDSRVLELAEKARRYDKDQAEKKVKRTVPKLARKKLAPPSQSRYPAGSRMAEKHEVVEILYGKSS